LILKNINKSINKNFLNKKLATIYLFIVLLSSLTFFSKCFSWCYLIFFLFLTYYYWINLIKLNIIIMVIYFNLYNYSQFLNVVQSYLLLNMLHHKSINIWATNQMSLNYCILIGLTKFVFPLYLFIMLEINILIIFIKLPLLMVLFNK